MLQRIIYLMAIAASICLIGMGNVATAQSVTKSLRDPGTAGTATLDKPTTGSALGGSLLSGVGKGAGLSQPYSFAATYEAEQSGKRGRITVTATMEEGFYIYSTTQPKAGPTPTFISTVSPGVSITGPFAPERDPEVIFDLEGFEGIRVEKFYDKVVWTAPITFNEQVTDGANTLTLSIDGQVCRKNACIPIISAPVEASFAGFYASEQATGEPYRDPLGHVTWTVQLEHGVVKPGRVANLLIVGRPDEGYHLYPVQANDPEHEQRTLIGITQKGILSIQPPTASSQPITVEMAPGLSSTYHTGDVTWTIPIVVDADKAEGTYPIAGVVGYQACTETNCDQPLAFRFTGEINVGASAQAESSAVPLALVAADFDEAMQAHKSQNWSTFAPVTQRAVALPFMSLVSYFCMAVLGGFILNFMPCVLPVIGLKVMSFVSEAHGDKHRSSMLNLWYAAGMISVFLALAIITIAIKYVSGATIGWGEQFGFFGLRVAIIILLFAMALSFLGVWEIPIPGFATGSQSASLSRKEGIAGAFSKGVITTIVATPCSGPFLGTVFALSLTQSYWVILLMYLGVGGGMAFPYFVIAAYPESLRVLPKPGAWMETLKQILAFPLLLSVVWFLATIENDYRIATVTLLVFVGFACWLIGKVPLYAELEQKAKAWIAAIATCALAGWASFQYLGPREHLIDWRPYNETELRELVASGKPVMIDFTASWCNSCQYNSLVAIETQDVANAIREHGVVPMLADWSDRGLTIKRKLEELNCNSIPVLAIYPAGNSVQPIVLEDVLTKGMVLKAIDEVAASRTDINLTEQRTAATIESAKANDGGKPSVSAASKSEGTAPEPISSLLNTVSSKKVHAK